MTPKTWHTSSTIRTNLGLLALSAVLAGLDVLDTAHGQLSLSTLLLIASAVANIILRFRTSQPLQPIIIRGPVAQVTEGGVTFTGPTTIAGIVAGHDADDDRLPPLEDV